MFLTQLDYLVFKFINGFADHLPWMDAIMVFFAKDAEYLFYAGIILYWFTRSKENRRMVSEAMLSACTAFGVSMILSHMFYRNRPFVVHTVNQLIGHPANASFPSDHAIGAFVIASSIWLFRKRDGSLWFAAAAIIAFSRIWTGVHYPLDVISGAVIGIGSAVCIHTLFKHSTLIQKLFHVGLELYERIEQRVWQFSRKRA